MKLLQLIVFACLLPICAFTQQTIQYHKIHQDSSVYKFEIRGGLGHEADVMFIYKDDILLQELGDFKRDARFGLRDLVFQDVNFDGYIDLMVYAARARASKFNGKPKFREPAQQHVWLYQPQKKVYSYSSVLSDLPNFTLDAEKKVIIVEQYVLHAHCQHSGDIFSLGWTERGELEIVDFKHIDSRNGLIQPIKKAIPPKGE